MSAGCHGRGSEEHMEDAEHVEDSARAKDSTHVEDGAHVKGGAHAKDSTHVKGSAAHGYIAHGDKDALIKRMRRIEGQARGIEKMIAEERYCIDILTQIAAVDTALEAVAFKILEDHVNHCVRRALASGDEVVAAEKSKELLEAVYRFARTR